MYDLFTEGTAQGQWITYIHEVPKSNRLSFHTGQVSELWHKTMVSMFSSIVLKSRPVLMSQKLRKQTSRQQFQKSIPMFSIWANVNNY